MIREVTIFKLKSEILEEAIQLFENYAAFKRSRAGCLTAAVNPVVKDASLPYLDPQSILVYAEYDNLKCLAECNHALQEHFNINKIPFQNFLVGPPIYSVFEG